MNQSLQATKTADSVSAVVETMSEDNKHDEPTFWQRYRMPIILGIVALSLYLGSIIWMVFGRGPIV